MAQVPVFVPWHVAARDTGAPVASTVAAQLGSPSPPSPRRSRRSSPWRSSGSPPRPTSSRWRPESPATRCGVSCTMQAGQRALATVFGEQMLRDHPAHRDASASRPRYSASLPQPAARSPDSELSPPLPADVGRSNARAARIRRSGARRLAGVGAGQVRRIRDTAPQATPLQQTRVRSQRRSRNVAPPGDDRLPDAEQLHRRRPHDRGEHDGRRTRSPSRAEISTSTAPSTATSSRSTATFAFTTADASPATRGRPAAASSIDGGVVEGQKRLASPSRDPPCPRHIARAPLDGGSPLKLVDRMVRAAHDHRTRRHGVRRRESRRRRDSRSSEDSRARSGSDSPARSLALPGAARARRRAGDHGARRAAHPVRDRRVHHRRRRTGHARISRRRASHSAARFASDAAPTSPRGVHLRALFLGLLVYLALWIATALFSRTPGVGTVLRVLAIAITWVAATVGLGATLSSRAGTHRATAPASKYTSDELAWQTPTPVTGVAASSRRPVSSPSSLSIAPITTRREE